MTAQVKALRHDTFLPKTVKFPVSPACETDIDLPALLKSKKVAIVHDWCPSFRGGERVLSEICRVIPEAEVFTLFDFLPADIKDEYFSGVAFHTSIANNLPLVDRYYRALFFACPFLIEQFDVTSFDLVISSSAAFARGVLTRPDQPHLSYVHSPVRYAWDEQFSYLKQGGLGFGPKGLVFRYMMHRLRMWDTRTANSPDAMLANSSYVRSRIRRIYGRDSEVIFPPVHMNEVQYREDKDDYFVTASFLAPYKRTDLVIDAFNAMPTRRLVVVGEGQQLDHLRKRARPNVSFTGYLSRTDYMRTVASARAFVFAGCEDFGIALAEAQACGTPVVAFGRGGARDIVRPADDDETGRTGILFDAQSVDSLIAAIQEFEADASGISSRACRQNAQRFSDERFRREIGNAVGHLIAAY